jgi:hypothetical protein
MIDLKRDVSMLGHDEIIADYFDKKEYCIEMNWQKGWLYHQMFGYTWPPKEIFRDYAQWAGHKPGWVYFAGKKSAQISHEREAQWGTKTDWGKHWAEVAGVSASLGQGCLIESVAGVDDWMLSTEELALIEPIDGLGSIELASMLF